MSVERQLIAEFVSDIWRLLVGRSVSPTTAPPPVGPGWTFACVQITGMWRGTVTVAAAPDLVRAVAAALLAVPPEQVTDADRADALGELACMVAGNLKAILPPPCYVSRPSVDVGDGNESHSVARRRVLRAAFDDPAGAFVVTVAETHKPAGRRRHPERPSTINPLSDCETSGRFPAVAGEDYIVINTPAPRGGSPSGAATPDDPLR